MCESDFSSIRKWSWNASVTDDQDQFLVEQGWLELKSVAANFQGLYPNLLNGHYEPEKYYFRHTKTQRTKASFQAFAEGLFGTKGYQNITIPIPSDNDTVLKAYDLCPAWAEQSEGKKDQNSEYQKFIQSPIYQKLISDVSLKLGFKSALSAKQIDTIWDICRYEQAWDLKGYSAWCAVFTKPQIDLLEYLEDIKYYYKQGYGYELNSNVGCFTIQDMLTHLQSETHPDMVAYFGHSTTVQLFLTAFGIAKDKEPVNAKNFEKMKDRSWKTSKVGPFAANFAAVKYE